MNGTEHAPAEDAEVMALRVIDRAMRPLEPRARERVAVWAYDRYVLSLQPEERLELLELEAPQ